MGQGWWNRDGSHQIVIATLTRAPVSQVRKLGTENLGHLPKFTQPESDKARVAWET